jgi:hypothetical protein
MGRSRNLLVLCMAYGVVAQDSLLRGSESSKALSRFAEAQKKVYFHDILSQVNARKTFKKRTLMIDTKAGTFAITTTNTVKNALLENSRLSNGVKTSGSEEFFAKHSFRSTRTQVFLCCRNREVNEVLDV